MHGPIQRTRTSTLYIFVQNCTIGSSVRYDRSDSVPVELGCREAVPCEMCLKFVPDRNKQWATTKQSRTTRGECITRRYWTASQGGFICHKGVDGVLRVLLVNKISVVLETLLLVCISCVMITTYWTLFLPSTYMWRSAKKVTDSEI